MQTSADESESEWLMLIYEKTTRVNSIASLREQSMAVPKRAEPNVSGIFSETSPGSRAKSEYR